MNVDAVVTAAGGAEMGSAAAAVAAAAIATAAAPAANTDVMCFGLVAVGSQRHCPQAGRACRPPRSGRLFASGR
jgi:hypothetical protein